jgi:EmrB/QacA subfamily drug resistance transporter
MVGVMAIIGDLVPPRERGRYQGMMAGIMAIAMVLGPLVGGFITDNLSWRWAFYVNLPLGGAALILLATRMHLPKYRTEHRIDWIGAALLSVGITSIVLIATWGGHEYAWASAQIIGLAVLAVGSLIGFALVERRTPEPIIPLRLFANRNFALVSAIGFLLGFAMFGAMNFLTLFQQFVQGASATNSGLLLLPLMFGMLIVSIVSGRLITKTGRYRIFPIIGGFAMTAGMVLLATLDVTTTKTQLALFMVVLGAGMGFLMQTSMLIAQNSVDIKDMGAGSGAATFFRSIGGSFGISMFGGIFINRLTGALSDRFGAQAAEQLTAGGGGGGLDPTAMGQASPDMRLGALTSLADSIADVFLWAIPFAATVAVLAWFIKEIPLRGHDTPPGQSPEEQAEEALADAPAVR